MNDPAVGNEYRLLLNGTQETLLFGRFGGEVARRGQVLCLNGPLGAGKTTLVSGMAQGLGLQAVTQSPTFTLVAEYPEGRVPLYHMDLYRLAEQAPMEMELFDEYLYGDGVCAIEWSQWIQAWLPEDRLELAIHKVEEPDARQIELVAFGKLSMEVLKEWIDRWLSWQWTHQQTN